MAVKPRANAPTDVVQVNSSDEPFGKQADHGEIDAADKSKPLQNLADVLRSSAARPYARNEAAVLAHVVREFRGIENNPNVEEREQDDHEDIEQIVERLAKADGLHSIVDELILALKQQSDGGRKRQQRAGKNRRNHAAGIDAERKIGGLSAHNAAAHDAFRVLHGDAALRALHIDDESHNRDHQNEKEEQRDRSKRPPSAGAGLFVEIANRSRQPNHNAYEDDE